MKAILVHEFGAPSVMRLEDAPVRQPGPRQVLVRVRAVGVNPVDTYIRSGVYALKPPLPYTPGSDAAGVVEAVGPEVHRFKPGDRVYSLGTITGLLNGAYAEMLLAGEPQVHPLPDTVTFGQGAALGVPYTTAYRALFQRGRALAGETVLVHGASGAVGIAVVELANAHGMRVLGTAGTPDGAALAREHGAETVFDHTEAGYADRIKDATGGRGVDLVVEMAAHVNLGRDLTLLAPRGRVIVVGSRGPVEVNPRDTMGRDADIRGMALWNAPPEDIASANAGLGAGLRHGTLRPVVRTELPLDQAPKAHELVLQPGAYGKIVLVP
jgi:NADPH2:quinone reductase